MLGQMLDTFLPDPMGVDGGRVARNRRTYLSDHGKRDVKVVVGMGTPSKAELVTELPDANRPLHRPEMAVGERDVDGLQLQAMSELSPISINHVGGGRHAGTAPELAHDLTARVSMLGTTGILAIGQDPMHVLAELDRLVQTPTTVRVKGHTGIGKSSLQGPDGSHLLAPPQNATLQLEVMEAILLAGSLGQRHHRIRIHRLVVADTVPLAGRILFGQIR